MSTVRRSFLIINSGSIAAVSAVCATYLSYLLPGIPGLMQWTPAALIFTLSAINYLGVRQGALVQNLFTFFKLAGIGLPPARSHLLEVSAQIFNQPDYDGLEAAKRCWKTMAPYFT